MSVKSFKFVSPGVFINEIDNSHRPRRQDTIGPVVIGRAQRGPAMQPIKVESYSEFVQVFGETVPGRAGGDVYRDGNNQSAMYGTYAAKAFLKSNVAPLTYIRLLGEENEFKTVAGRAGWQTEDSPAGTLATNGGAYGLWLFDDSNRTANDLGTGSLAAIWYADEATAMMLSGGYTDAPGTLTSSVGSVLAPNSDGNFVLEVSSAAGSETFEFNFNDSTENYARKVFNTNPQLGNSGATDFYNTSKKYWLGETFDQQIRDAGLNALSGVSGMLVALANSADVSDGPHINRVGSQEARTGWFFSQDLGEAATYDISAMQKLFYFTGRGHGEWLHKNMKVSVENIRPSSTSTSAYGTFSVVLRSMSDTDSRVSVMERFDNLTLDPASENYIAKVIGDMYMTWDEGERRLREYGDYTNQSKFIRVYMNADVEDAAHDPRCLPFGYEGPNRYRDIVAWTGLTTLADGDYIWDDSIVARHTTGYIMTDAAVQGTASFSFPTARLRNLSTDGGLVDQKDAYFGMQTTRGASSSRSDSSIGDFHRYLPGATEVSYRFSLDDLVVDVTGSATYTAGSRLAGTSRTATSGSEFLMETDRYNRITAPLWGGFDGFDITKPDPVYNAGLSTGTELTNYAYNTMKRAIDTVADPEFADMNLLAAPGLTNTGLTTHMIDLCESRGDAMAIIDLPGVYVPRHEAYAASKQARVTGNPSSDASDLRQRQIDSSYGATFYPWVQTRDEPTGQMLWVPPSVAAMGTLASSEKTSQVWFAPAGFNRGGLSDGAAGIPVTNVSQRLTSKERDILYEARINPIASFPSSGIVIFGQKTLQERPSALDRINVRRLVIYLKKQISILSTQVLFEQNVQATWNRFKGLIEPFLANVKTQFGISDYRLILDETTTTPDLVDQNIMYAKIMVKPARAIEYIAIDFVVASSGASFDD